LFQGYYGTDSKRALKKFKPGMMTHACNPSIPEAETRGKFKNRLNSKTLTQKEEINSKVLEYLAK
jgi:hypothetical protein